MKGNITGAVIFASGVLLGVAITVVAQVPPTTPASK